MHLNFESGNVAKCFKIIVSVSCLLHSTNVGRKKAKKKQRIGQYVPFVLIIATVVSFCKTRTPTCTGKLFSDQQARLWLHCAASTQEKYFSIFTVFLQTRAFDTKTSQTKVSFKMSLRDLSVKHSLPRLHSNESRSNQEI